MIYGDWIGRWGRARPHSEAMVDAITGTRYTYAELATEINRMAHLLAGRLGVQKGDRVSCLSFNRAEYIFLFLALSRLGAVMVPLNFRLAQGEFLYFFEDSKPKALFYDADHAETVAGFRDRSGIESFVCFDRGDHPGSPSRSCGTTCPRKTRPRWRSARTTPSWSSTPPGPRASPRGPC